jgi:TolA-binding protein
VSQREGNELNALKQEVDGLRIRLDKQGDLLRSTNAAVTRLADSLGKVVAGQHKRERWVNLNSFVAYTLFTVLLGGGFFMLYDQRAGDLMAARAAAVSERDTAKQEIESLRAEAVARDEAEKAAHEYYQLLRDDRRSEAIARYPELESKQLTPTERALFADGVKDARSEIVDAGYLSGLDAYRAGDLDKSVSELRTALAYEAEGPRAAQMRYYLGLSFYKKADYDSAARQLELSLAGRVDQAGITDVRFYLATCLEKIGQLEQARAEYDKFASANPNHEWTVTARRRSAQLARRGIRTN